MALMRKSFELARGYSLYFGGAYDSLKKGNVLAATLARLALFLVFVVMAVQYESLGNPAAIMVGVPFALIGLLVTRLPLSMPVCRGEQRHRARGVPRAAAPARRRAPRVHRRLEPRLRPGQS
jgi:multidrug efflux pump subunit AcrB